MKVTRDWCSRGTRRWTGLRQLWVMVLLLLAHQLVSAQAVSTTTVQGTVYLANGQTGAGTLTVSWPSFTTANGLAVAAGRSTVTIAPDGFVSVNLAPNVGATPAGLYYTAVYQMSNGTTNTEYWVVPAAAQATLAAVRAQIMPAAQAVQTVSKSYVDQSISELTQSLLTASGGSLSGSLYLNGDPTQPLQAATKHYVDSTFSQAVPLAGGNMTGGLQTPTVNGVQSPATGSEQTTLQAAVTAAGTSGAVEIPPTYSGTDGFTNPNGVRVMDLRTKGAQASERSVKEFGAVCDGVTDDTNALQSALNYAYAHGVALTIPQGTCKTRTLNWHGESISGMGKQVSALMGFPGQDVLATVADSTNLLSNTRIHDLTIYVDQSQDVSCSAANGRAGAGICAVNRPMESNSIFAPGGNGQTGTAGTGAGWAVGNCAIAMPAATGAGGNGLKVADIDNVEITATGTDPLAAQYPGAHSTHTCGLYLGQWPQWSEFRNIDIRGLNTGIAIPALTTTPAGLTADSNRWQNITIQATHAFTAAAGSNDVLDNVVAQVGNSSATGEPPTGLVLDLPGGQQGWTVRNAVVTPSWTPVQPTLTVTAAGGAVTGVTAGSEMGLGFDPYGTTVPVSFSGSCTAQATANVNTNGSIGTITVTQGGVGCSATTTATINATGNWDTAAPVNLIGGQDMTFYAGNLLQGTGGYTVWNATGSGVYGTQMDNGGGNLPGGGNYAALVANSPLGTTLPVDQFPGADFGAKLQACVNAVNAQYGGDCDARNFTGTLSMSANVTISKANTTVQLPCATISTANQIIVTGGTRNVVLHGCSLRGSSAASGTLGGTVFLYSGAGAAIQVGDPTYAVNTMGFHIDNAVINTTASSSATAQALVAYRTQEMDLESLYFLGNSTQTGMTLDGTGNYTGGTFYDNAFNGFQTAVNAIGHQTANSATTDWMNASTFVRLHIDCPMSGGSPISGTYGINLQQGDGNTFTGGDVEGCSTALHLGANAQNNTIVGLRNENSTNQVVADAGSSYNNWMTGGTMFTGALTDNGTRNSFMDAFHRTFNGMKGDYYGSQQDATITNHYRLGVGTGNERGLLNRYQTDSGYRWTTGLSDATAGEQFYQVLDELNNVYRLSIGQYNTGQSSTNNQTVINSAGTGAVVLNGSNNAGTGGVQIGSGGANESTVASISSTGNAQFNGTLQVGGTTTFSATPTVKNQADAEIDETLWAGLTTPQKESLIYKDWNGASQWYMQKDTSNNWALNSATGGLDSFKAYQSTNSGDTYIDASNSTGAVRINYETGSGTAFNIYGGSSSNLYASFAGPTMIKFPGLAAGSGRYCLQIDNSGYITNTGSSCSTGIGTVGTGNSGQIAYYTANGTSIGGMSSVPLTAGGTGATTASGALANLGAQPALGYVPLNPTNNLSEVSSPTTALTNLGAQPALGYTPLKPSNNLSDVASSATALTNLGAVPLAGGTMTGALTAPQFNGALSGNATTATALAATPAQCASNKYATGVNASGAATCSQVTYSQLSGTTPTWNQNTTGTAANVTGTVALANGGTGATTAANAFANIVAPGGTLTGALTAPQFNGPLTGNVTGNVSGTAANVTGTVSLANGGTGATTAASALANLLPGVASDGSSGFSVAGSTQVNGALQVGGATTFSSTPVAKNQADAEIDATLWAGLTTSQKESLIYKDWDGTSQWYMQKDANNNWALNSATGGLDSFKAYQNTNSGDTYVNASNTTGAVRVNYEPGSGTAFDVYNGNSGTLLASFAAPGNVQFPALASGNGHNCLQVDSSGYITNTGAECGAATSGNNITVSTANAGSVAYYSGNGTSISGMTSVPVTAGGTGATTAAGAVTNLLPGVSADGASGIKVQAAVAAGRVNGVVNAMMSSGADMGAKINAAQASGNVEIEIPSGTYSVTTPITINQPNVRLRFDNGAVLTKAVNAVLITVTGSNTSIVNPNIDGNAASTATVSSIAITSGTALVTLTGSMPSNCVAGGSAVIAGSGITGVDNATLTISSVGSNTFQFSTSATGSSATGTVTCGYSNDLVDIIGTDGVVIGQGSYRNSLNHAILIKNATNTQVTGYYISKVAGDNISISGNVWHTSIGPGVCDASSNLIWHKCISAHSYYSGMQISDLSIVAPVIKGAYSFGIEVGAFGGLSPLDVSVTNPVMTYNSPSLGGGGYSFDSVIGLTLTNPQFFNVSGLDPNDPAIEIVNTDKFSIAGGIILGGSVSLNKARHGTLTGATIQPIYPGTGVYLGTSVAGADADYLTVTGNHIDRTGLVKGRTTWVASTNYSIGFTVTDGTNLEMVVNCTATGTPSQPCQTGTTTPTWNASYGGTTSDNGVTWENIGPYISSPITAFGVYLQCNAVADCSNNTIVGNVIQDDGTATNQGITISNGAGTVTHTLVASNILTGWPTCYYVSASASVDLWLNDETGCSALGSSVTSGITAGNVLYRGSSATNKTPQPWITTSTVEADGGYYVGSNQVIGSNGRLAATSLPAGTNYLDFPNTQMNVSAQDTGSTMSYMGITGTLFGTATHQLATSTGALPPKANVATAATSASLAGYQDAANYLVSKNPDWQAWAGIPSSGDYVNTRIWVGLGAGASTDYNSDTPADSYAAFRASTTAGDTNWKCVTSNGTSQTVADSGVAITEGGGNRFEVALISGTSATFLINGTQVCSITTNLPTGLLASKMYTVTQEAVAKNLWISRWFVALNP